MTGTKVIFQGVKFYWRTRNTIDVTVVEHAEQNITEVVLFDPSLGRESPRLYLSSRVLLSKLDHDDIEGQLSFAKRNCVPITEKFVDGIMKKAKSDFILNRLVITEYSVELKKVVVSFQLSGADCDTDSLICEKPEDFEAFKTVHYQTLMAGVVDRAIAALEVEKAQLVTECDRAQQLEKFAECSTKSLSNKQRWRIPIVFIKVASSKRLSVPDAKIWAAVTQNMRTEEDAARMAAVLARTRCRQTSRVPSAGPTAAPSRSTSFVGVHGTHQTTSPCPTPRHHNSVTHSKLHQATAATRHRTEGAHAGAHSLSRQNSYRQSSLRQSDISSGELSYNSRMKTEGATAVPRSRNSEDEAGELGYNSRTKAAATVTAGAAAGKAPKTPKSSKRSGSKGGAKKGKKSLLSRLRKTLNGSPTATSKAAESVEGEGEGEGAAATDTASSADVSGGCLDATEQSTLQRLIASLGTLNTSLRASIGGLRMSGMYCSMSAVSQQSDTTKSTKGANLTACASGASTAEEATLSEAELRLHCAITQAAKGAALVPVPVTQVKAKPEQKRGSFLLNKPGSDKEDLHTGSDKQGPLAAMHKFISELVNWRSTNKIYADCAQE